MGEYLADQAGFWQELPSRRSRKGGGDGRVRPPSRDPDQERARQPVFKRRPIERFPLYFPKRRPAGHWFNDRDDGRQKDPVQALILAMIANRPVDSRWGEG